VTHVTATRASTSRVNRVTKILAVLLSTHETSDSERISDTVVHR